MTVSSEQKRDSATHIHVYILPQTPLPFRLPHNIKPSSLCYTVGFCWLSTPNTAVCTCSTQTRWAILTLGNQQQIPNVCICIFTAHICTCTHRGTHTHVHTHTHSPWASSGCWRVSTTYSRIWGLPRLCCGREPACHCRRCKRHRCNPWVGKIPGGGNGNPLQYFCLENLHGQRRVVDYSPWGHKESDKIEFSDLPVWLPWMRVFQEKPERINWDPTNTY